MNDDSPALITLDEAARLFPSGSVSANTLKRRIRQGKLKAYRPGKAFLTTVADVHNMVRACSVSKGTSVNQLVRTSLNEKAASDALGAALVSLLARKERAES